MEGGFVPRNSLDTLLLRTIIPICVKDIQTKLHSKRLKTDNMEYNRRFRYIASDAAKQSNMHVRLIQK